jgi:sugar O-acyltransferase (sialic acid O-acetyltransferase NeuD family)
MKRFAVFGASGFGREIMPIVRNSLTQTIKPEDYDLVFIDDNPADVKINNCQVLAYREWLSLPATSRFMTIAIANSQTRSELVNKSGFDKVEAINVRAANVIEMDDVEIGEGFILCPFVTLTSNIKIGRFFHANIYSYVAHDCIIGDFVTFAPGVMCNGNVVIEDHAYIGTGAVIKQGLPGKPLVIGRGAIVGMGAVVTKSVPPGVTVVGNPARIMT